MMKSAIKTAANFFLLLLLPVLAFADGATISFVACPVYRDTDAGPKSGCWLATERDSGITYDIGSGLTKPLSDRAVLVEGVRPQIADQDRALCGGEVLSPVRVSVLEEKCHPHILPAENYPGRVFRPPGETMRPLTVERTLPAGPYADKTFTILFNYGSDFLNYQYSEVILEKASLYIQASKPAVVTVTGYAATEPLTISGRDLMEDLPLARARAEKVATALLRLQVPQNKIDVEWHAAEVPVEHYAGGLAQETLRRVDIEIRLAK